MRVDDSEFQVVSDSSLIEFLDNNNNRLIQHGILTLQCSNIKNLIKAIGKAILTCLWYITV